MSYAQYWVAIGLAFVLGLLAILVWDLRPPPGGPPGTR